MIPDANTEFAAIVGRLAGRQPAVFLDYDGTLAPISPTPADAKLSDAAREALRRLAARMPVAIVGDRSRSA